MGHVTLDEASRSIVSPYASNQSTELARIFAEISERTCEQLRADPDLAACPVRELGERVRSDERVSVGAIAETLSWFLRLCDARIEKIRHTAMLQREICELLEEAVEINPEHAQRWILRMNGVLQRQTGPETLYWYCMLQTGDYAALTESLSSIGRHNGLSPCRSKQAVQQELERATDDLVRIFPSMAAAIHELRRSVKRYV